MRTGSGLRAASLPGWLVACVLPLTMAGQFLAAGESDYLPNEADRAAVPFDLDAKAERQAQAMAHFVTGVLDEESQGAERALESYREVLRLDPGFTRLAIEVSYDYLRRGATTAAIGVLKDAIKARPQEPSPALALSSIYLRHLRKPDLATRYAELALKADPNRFSPYEMLWEIQQAQGNAAGCAAVLERASRSKTTRTTFWLQLADFLANSSSGNAFSDPRTAAKIVACLDKAAQFAGNDAVALARIADFHVLNRQHAKAADFYGKAAELKPSLPNIHERLAASLIELGRKREAIPVLEKVIASDPLALAAYDQLYVLHEERGDFAKALNAIEQALLIDRNNFGRQRDLMLLLMRTGRVEGLAERAGEARKLFPQVPFFTYVQARAYAATGRNEEAMKAFERTIVEAATGDPSILGGPFYFDYACAAQQAGRSAEAAELFRKSLELDPNNADAYNALGYLWVERNENLDEAEQLIRKALNIEPGNGAFLDSLGWLYYQRGKYAEALVELLRASKALPQPDPVVLEHVADTYRALNRTAEAVLYWQKAAQLDPSNKALLGKIDAATGKVAQQPAP
jgi:tetratricopeptide (TPR) repeat protein